MCCGAEAGVKELLDLNIVSALEKVMETFPKQHDVMWAASWTCDRLAYKGQIERKCFFYSLFQRLTVVCQAESKPSGCFDVRGFPLCWRVSSASLSTRIAGPTRMPTRH